MDTTSTTSRPKYLLSVDPGLATGMALLDVTDLENVRVVGSWELDVEEFYDAFEEILIDTWDENSALEIVAENFIITVQTAKLSQAPWSLELLGVMKFLARKYDFPLKLQKPDEKSFARDDKVGNAKLRKVGFWHKGGEGHANDAFRHALVYIVNQHPQWAKRLIV